MIIPKKYLIFNLDKHYQSHPDNKLNHARKVITILYNFEHKITALILAMQYSKMKIYVGFY